VLPFVLLLHQLNIAEKTQTEIFYLCQVFLARFSWGSNIFPLKKYPTNLDNLSIEPDFTECYNILVKKDDVKRRKVK
jgi:hypothetical protein